METINKIFKKIVFDEAKDKFVVRHKIKTYNYDPINQHILGSNPIAVREEFLPLSILGENEPKKSVKVPIILKKSNVNTETLENMVAYFSQTLQAKILTDSTYKFLYLTVCENKIFLHNLISGMTTPFVLSATQEGTSKEFLGKERRLTDDEALKMLNAGCPCYEKAGSEFRILI